MTTPTESQELVLLELLGRNTRTRRSARGMTQAQLAAMAGFSRTYLIEVEKGRRNVSLISLFRLSAALACDVRDLLDPLG